MECPWTGHMASVPEPSYYQSTPEKKGLGQELDKGSEKSFEPVVCRMVLAIVVTAG